MSASPTDGSLRQNLELKARCPDAARVSAALQRLGAKDEGVLVQKDTYFHAPHGRLKLREIDGCPAQLIAYDRPEDQAQRMSQYRITEVADPEGLGAVLTAALGLRGVVAKRRQLYLWQDCRIHLDEVAGLGSFLEFEVVSQGSSCDDWDRMETLMTCFGLHDSDAIQASYSDLLGF
jgi:predicted adenylyl cyclase CyaB